jgi:gas vesicle protein
MGQNSEELTTTPADIAATRENLSRDIDELTDKVNPARVVDRRKEAARSRFGSVKERVMGAVPSPSLSSSGGSGGGIGSSVSSAKDSVSGSASGALGTVESKAQGNPLAAGLIAFGAGMLISALIPASEKEAQAAQRAVEAAKEHGQPLVDEAKSVGQQMGQDLKESATDSAQQVKATAQDSAQTVKEQGQDSARTVKDQGQASAQTVKDDARPNS